MTDLLEEIHPGEILREDFMKPLGITVPKLAVDLDVTPRRIRDLLHGSRPITADIALRLGLYFSMDPRFWINLQTEYDMRMVLRKQQDNLALRIQIFRPATTI